jgi:hypothetical protein
VLQPCRHPPSTSFSSPFIRMPRTFPGWRTRHTATWPTAQHFEPPDLLLAQRRTCQVSPERPKGAQAPADCYRTCVSPLGQDKVLSGGANAFVRSDLDVAVVPHFMAGPRSVLALGYKGPTPELLHSRHRQAQHASFNTPIFSTAGRDPALSGLVFANTPTRILVG